MKTVYHLYLLFCLAKDFQTTKQDKVLCKPVGNVQFGIVKYNNNEVTLHCYDGYKPVSSKVAVCGENGQWSEHNFNCEAIQCRVPELPNGKWTKPPIFSFREVLIASCKSGYTLTGSDTSIACLSDGKWSRHNAKCTAPTNMHFYFVVASMCALLGAGILMSLGVIFYLFKARSRTARGDQVFTVHTSSHGPPYYQERCPYQCVNTYQQYPYTVIQENFHQETDVSDEADRCYSLAETLPCREMSKKDLLSKYSSNRNESSV